ncbi:hypothetical protein DOY81_010415 [Sarcophaga bullata]|nr:hypothetical protein DOY81_010415 [Sarcophaga bullata]
MPPAAVAVTAVETTATYPKLDADASTNVFNTTATRSTMPTTGTVQQHMLQTKVQSSVKHKSVKNTLHHALGPFLVLSRFCGVLPVMGVWPTADVEKVYFKWFTLPVLVTLILTSFATLDLFLTFRVMSEQGLKLSTTGPFTFCIECLSAFIVFLCISRNWPNLIRATRHLENIFFQPLYTCKESRRFSQSIRFIGWCFLIGSAFEHVCYVASGLYSNHLQITQCNLTVNFWRNYYIRERLQIFSIVEYTPWLIPLLQVR